MPSCLPLSRILALAALAAVTTAAGCAQPQARRDAATTMESDSRPEVRQSARETYVAGMKALVNGNFTRAVQLFNRVARSPRYVRLAALARLRIGDALYLQERHEEAIEAYRSFVAQHASDPNLPYARYRMASAYHARMPTDWFATPNAWEKDQSTTRQAERELSGFLRRFPTSRWAPDARERLREVQTQLLNHELYVAEYYGDRDEWRGAAWRLDHAIREYPDLATTPARVWELAKAYERAGETADAARAYAMYLEAFPDGPRSGQARDSLESIRRELDAPAR